MFLYEVFVINNDFVTVESINCVIAGYHLLDIVTQELLFSPVLSAGIVLVNPDAAILHGSECTVFAQEVRNDLVVGADFNDSVLLAVVSAVEHDAVFFFVDECESSFLLVEPQRWRKLVRKCFPGGPIRILVVDRHFQAVEKHYCYSLFFQELELRRFLFERVFLFQLYFPILHLKYPKHFLRIGGVKALIFMFDLVNFPLFLPFLLDKTTFAFQVSLTNELPSSYYSVF